VGAGFLIAIVRAAVLRCKTVKLLLHPPHHAQQKPCSRAIGDILGLPGELLAGMTTSEVRRTAKAASFMAKVTRKRLWTAHRVAALRPRQHQTRGLLPDLPASSRSHPQL